ncbi:unnamed protein product, partial [Allacma fusca]
PHIIKCNAGHLLGHPFCNFRAV